MEMIDVAVIGLGPVGSAGALLLGAGGLKIAAFERDAEVYLLPRAVAMDGEVVRAMQGIGLGEEFAGLLQHIRPGERAGFANAKREWMFGQDLMQMGPHGWSPMSMFHQPDVDGWLRDRATAHENIDAYVGFDVLGAEDKGDHVIVRAKHLTTGEVVEVVARYVIACDGASSPIRQSLGVGRHDLGYNQDWLVVDVEMNDESLLPPETLQVCSPDRLTTYVATKDPYRRWEFRLNEGETAEGMLEEERIFSLLDDWAPRGSYKVIRAAVYQFHALVADSWRKGRVFLAGDAAHQTPPFLGQGMNAGMRDVINLAWKLPRVISGVSSDNLLDTYFEERIAHSTDLVEWAVTFGRLMEFFAAQERAARGEGPEPTDPPALSAAYGQGRTIPPMRDGLLVKEQVNDMGFTGYQLEQPIARDESGRTFRLDEALGSGFAVVARSPADLELTGAARSIARVMDMKLVNLDGWEAAEWRFDPLFEKYSAAVVRPDKFIFGHTDGDHSLSDLIIDLGERLGLEAHASA